MSVLLLLLLGIVFGYPEYSGCDVENSSHEQIIVTTWRNCDEGCNAQRITDQNSGIEKYSGYCKSGNDIQFVYCDTNIGCEIRSDDGSIYSTAICDYDGENCSYIERPHQK